MIRVTHVIDGLSVGGAEIMLERLIEWTEGSLLRSEVISLTDIGPVGQRIAASGVPVRALGLSPRPSGAPSLLRLPGWLRATKPDLVQTWLYHGDLLGGVVSRLATRRAPVVWGVHRSDLDVAWTKRRLATAARMCARVSRIVPTTIVCCSVDAAKRHVALGYDAERIVVIPNGFDLRSYAPDDAARREVRSDLGIPDDAPVVGMIARFDPQKDHVTMLEAARHLAGTVDGVHVVLCGAGVEATNPAFAAIVGPNHPLGERLHLLGLRSDVARIDAALDVAVLSSTGGEAFPLAIGEAMASAVPCVVTDVGDAGALVGDTGRVVPTQRPVELATAIAEVLALPADERRSLGAAARDRVRSEYEISDVVRRYCDVYREALSRGS